jgi:hypothetical protein
MLMAMTPRKTRLPVRYPSVVDRDSRPTRYNEPPVPRKEDRMPMDRFQPGDTPADLRLRVERLLRRKEVASVDAWAELGPETRTLLVDLLDDEAVRSRDTTLHRVIEVIGRLGIHRGIGPLTAILTDSSESNVTRAAAANALGRIGDPAALDALISVVSVKDDMVRRQVAMALGRIERESVMPHLVELSRDKSPAVAEVAEAAINRRETRVGRVLGGGRKPTAKATRTRPGARRKRIPAPER